MGHYSHAVFFEMLVVATLSVNSEKLARRQLRQYVNGPMRGDRRDLG